MKIDDKEITKGAQIFFIPPGGKKHKSAKVLDLLDKPAAIKLEFAKGSVGVQSKWFPITPDMRWTENEPVK